MSGLNFEAVNGVVMMDGLGRRVTVTQDQADWFAAFFWERRLIRQFNALWDAMQTAGYVPWASGRLAA